jgi:ABC-type Fe3+-hydroxamate transport system substrate-binding protein
MTADDLKAHPVFSQVPAVQEGQIFTWNDTHQLSYQGLTDALLETATALAASSKVGHNAAGRG